MLHDIILKEENIICNGKTYEIKMWEVSEENYENLNHTFIRWYTTVNGCFFYNKGFSKEDDFLTDKADRSWNDFCVAEMEASGRMRDVCQKMNSYKRIKNVISFDKDDLDNIGIKCLQNIETFFRRYWGIRL